MSVKTYNLKDGTEFKIKGYEEIPNKEGNTKAIPRLDIPFMSDYKWQLICLNDRIEHPELYEKTENVPEVIEKLKKWLDEHKPINA